MIPADSTLMIDPGVEVQFQGSYKLWALGRLIAAGTINDTIVFTANDSLTGWLGIRYDGTTASADTSVFRYCKFSFGRATASPNTSGGALEITHIARVKISHCRFTQCYAANGGGAISCGNSSVEITHCLFDKNSAFTCGAINIGSFPSASYKDIAYNIFSENYATGQYGGAIGDWGAHSIHDNLFYKNVSLSNSYSGGAIYCGSTSTLTINNNRFFNNASPNYGGGAIYSLANPLIVNNVFSNNQSKMGGALYYDGGGVYPLFINNTVMHNAANYGGAIYCDNGAAPTVINCILWDDTALVSGPEIYIPDQSNGPDISYSDIRGGSSAIGLASNIFYVGTYTNNISQNPLVAGPAAGYGLSYDGLLTNLALTGTSPCINAGNPTGSYPATDIAGNPRVFNSVVDMGAYELQGYFGIPGYFLSGGSYLFPNPASDVVYLGRHCNIKVFDSAGAEVMIGTGVDRIEVSHLPAGVYFLEKQIPQPRRQKFLVER